MMMSRIFSFRAVATALLMAGMCVSAFADDIVATTSSGATVILHDNGRWEYYQNNKNIHDVRPSAIPEDAKFEISIAYESVDKLKKDIRMAMDAEFATEEEIKDSLRSVPKGGIVYFQVPTKQIKPGMTRELTYYIYDKGKNPIFSKTVRDTEATPSEDKGISNLLVVPLYARPKVSVLKAKVISESTRSTLEFDIPVK
ncbi:MULTISPECIES: hypothetical protein [unclassified Fibrobacter]|uniref:hypothetical protein n=1 Tax=unclassified Fibrobacter TaxID=2634177 RepID=UPI000D790C3D|nr:MULTISPECIES: hypothetical protein [unclassified Fibrobacter]PWJ63753.1 hypothetical protein BGX12_11772 [Fibrobacter sp. UWR4]PZW69141.1 hypothetical protein C8E88_101673 [Fibrobacter sp. UWR1]